MAIVDSGDRTQYESGAVRDMKEGKGRCDLLPLSVVARLLGNDVDVEGKDTFIVCLDMYTMTQNVGHLYNALLYIADTFFTGIESMVLEVAKHFEEGAKKYGERNWEKGIPEWSFIDSSIRHYVKAKRGDADERHDRACAWNIMCLIWTHNHITPTGTIGVAFHNAVLNGAEGDW